MLEAAGLNAWYGDSHILHDVSLKVEAGARVAVLGRNGAGKTTLLKSVMNGGPRVAGRVAWQGEPLGRLPAWRRARLGLALVPEDRRIFTHVTVAENIGMAAHAASPERPALAPAEVLDGMPMLKPLAARLGGQLSGGQQQMLAFARAIAARPRLMLLDEPTEGLAPVIVEQLAAEVRRICERDQVGLLLCEQNIWFARRCTERCYILATGRIAFEGSWADFDAAGESARRHLAL
ncbi:MAG: ATP-binding cassette domain-containing protein [Acidobacteria bacterium]|nr:ATP-binding cassette domain-containing protein [Acidobacteriota bacterium]